MAVELGVDLDVDAVKNTVIGSWLSPIATLARLASLLQNHAPSPDLQWLLCRALYSLSTCYSIVYSSPTL